MFCKNCGKEMPEGNQFCIYCGTPIGDGLVNPETNPQPSNPTTDDDKEAKKLCIASLICMYAASPIAGVLGYCVPPLAPLFGTCAGLSPIAAIVLMIMARVKYPKNKFAKILMWIYIVQIILALLLFIILVVVCFYTCSTMDTSGCG